jgi:hypothetical protein
MISIASPRSVARPASAALMPSIEMPRFVALVLSGLGERQA